MVDDASSPVVVIGGGGHARVVIEAIRTSHEALKPVGILDRDPSLHGQAVSGVPVLGGDELMPSLAEAGHGVVVAVGDNRLREELFTQCVEAGLSPLPVVHGWSWVSPEATIAAGSVVLAGAVVNPEARIEENAVINTCAAVDHDCVVERSAHVGPGARLAGGVRVGRGSLVGLGASVGPGVRIGTGAVVGAGSVVLRDVPDGLTVVGVPARPVGAGRP